LLVATGELTGGSSNRDVALNPFEMDVRDRLTAAGMDLAPQVGVGSYRLDFATRHPDHPGRYVMAIEADGANYHSGHIARERDRLRQRLLEGRGWTFHRIWSTDWFNDCDREVRAAVQAYQDALCAEADVEEGADIPAEAVPAWHIAEAQRTTPRPRLPHGLTIDKYGHAELVRLVRHVRSDGVLRTREDELLLLMRELGFAKRGKRIVATLSQAQNDAG
jgi:very-short-patch-repair endonuclease